MRTNTFCSLETPAFISRDDDELVLRVLVRDTSAEYELWTHPELTFTQTGNRHVAALTTTVSGATRHLLEERDSIYVYCKRKDASGNRYDLMRDGDLVETTINVGTTVDDVWGWLETQTDADIAAGTSQLIIEGSTVRLDGTEKPDELVHFYVSLPAGGGAASSGAASSGAASSGAASSGAASSGAASGGAASGGAASGGAASGGGAAAGAGAATVAAGKPLDRLHLSVEPPDLAFEAQDENGRVRLSFTIAELQNVDFITIQAEVRGRTSTLQDWASKGLIARRTFGVVDAVAPEVRLDVLDQETSHRLFGRTFSAQFYACAVHINNPSEGTLIAYGTSVNARVQFHAESFEPWEEAYRPLSFSSILESLNDIQRESVPQQVLDWLSTAGELASGAAVFITGVDYPKGVALATGIFLPELRKRLLADVLAHLSNLQSLGFRDVEEVAPRSQVTKYLFLPRGPIYGVVGDEPARIIGVLPYDVGMEGYRVLNAKSVHVNEK